MLAETSNHADNFEFTKQYQSHLKKTLQYFDGKLKSRGHFHEIDEYRIGLLAKRAGYYIISKTRQKVWRDWWFYFTGVKPLMRLFFEYHAVYELKII